MPDLIENDVEWVVNNMGELGVKIGNQFFFLYKGRSLVYELPDKIKWRHVYKREFGEVCHPPLIMDFSYDRGQVIPEGDYAFAHHQEDWQDMPEQGS